jgi:ribosomal protein L24E
MRIHCDYCGTEIDSEDALAVEVEDEVVYFCSEDCRSRKNFHETMADPGREEEGDAPDPR